MQAELDLSRSGLPLDEAAPDEGDQVIFRVWLGAKLD
jgi:hypothetical protein